VTVCWTVLCAFSWPRLTSKTGLYIKLKVLFRGTYFLVFRFKAKIHYYCYKKKKKEKKRKKTEVVKETPTFDNTKNYEQCVQKDRVRYHKTFLKNQIIWSYQRPSKD
jgi:hypothetical protein